MNFRRAHIIACQFMLAGTASAMPNSTCGEASTYLSAGSEAYSYLEGEQRLIYEGNPDLATDPYLRESLTHPDRMKSIDEVIEFLQKVGCEDGKDSCLMDDKTAEMIRSVIACEPLPTIYESPLLFALLRLAVTDLTKGDPKLQAMQIRFGSLPTGTIDGKALIAPDSTEPIVILNRDVFHFTGKFSKALSAAIPIEQSGNYVGLSYDKAKIRERLRQQPWILDDFRQAMFLLVTNLPLGAAKESRLDADRYRFHGRLVRGLDSFIVGHEIAHIALGHVAKSRRSLRFMPLQTDSASSKPDVAITVQDYSGNAELEADRAGLFLFLRAAAGSSNDLLDAAIGAAGADLFFLVLEAADRYGTILGRSAQTDTDHPTASIRIKNLDKLMSSQLAQSLGLGELPDFRLITRSVFEVLIEEANPSLIRAFEAYRSGSR